MRYLIEYVRYDDKGDTTIFVYSTKNRRRRSLESPTSRNSDGTITKLWSKYDYRVVWNNIESPFQKYHDEYQRIIRDNPVTLSKHYNSFEEFQIDHPEIFYL